MNIGLKRFIKYTLAILVLFTFALSAVTYYGIITNEGKDIERTYINKNGELVIVYTDGYAEVMGPVTADDGKGIEYTYIDSDGELVVVYTDGEEERLGTVVGEDGADGEDGKDGANGKDGSVTVIGDGESISLASSKAMRSSVMVHANFVSTSASTGVSTPYGSAGSGVIYKYDHDKGNAFIITNYHVVFDAKSDTANSISDDISVFLYGSAFEEYRIPATYVGGSLTYDIAVLYVSGSDILKASHAVEAEVSSSDGICVGDTAIAIGNASGMGIAVSSGIVSVDSEYIDMRGADGVTPVSFRVMRVDTPVNKGNSGGGLFNERGELIGIVNAKIIDSTVENIGYAIPSNLALKVADNIIDYCFGTPIEAVQRPLMGVTVTTSESSAVYDSETGKIKIVESILVHEVSETSIIKDYLKAGDIYVSYAINGDVHEITRRHHIVEGLLSARVGDRITMVMQRPNDAGEYEEISFDFYITEGCISPVK